MADGTHGMTDADLKAWIQYAISLEGSIQMAAQMFRTQDIFDNFQDMYTVTVLDDAPIQAKAAAQQLRLQFLKRWNQDNNRD
jgi:hypothetical protein